MKRVSAKRVNAGGPGSYLVSYLVVLGVEAQDPVGSRLGASVSLAMREQKEQSVTWVTIFRAFP